MLVNYLQVESVSFSGKLLRIVFTNVSDNLIRIRSADLYAVLPRPVEFRAMLGLVRRKTSRVLAGIITGSRADIGPGEKGEVTVTLQGDPSSVFELLKQSYGWSGLLELVVKGEAIVGYARTLTDARAPVFKEFRVVYEIRIGRDGSVEEVKDREFKIIF